MFTGFSSSTKSWWDCPFKQPPPIFLRVANCDQSKFIYVSKPLLATNWGHLILKQIPDWYLCLDTLIYIGTQMFKYIVVIQDSVQGLSLFDIIE